MSSSIQKEFHTRKLSHSNSKQKNSPYRIKLKKEKKDKLFDQNCKKIELNKPNKYLPPTQLKDSEFMHKSKLRLNQDFKPGRTELESTNVSTEAYNKLLQLHGTHSFTELVEKIDEQTLFMKHHFRAIKKNLKLPKLLKQQEEQFKKEPNYLEYAYNQKIIIAYLEQLSKSSEEILALKVIVQEYKAKILNLQTIIASYNSDSIKDESFQIEEGLNATSKSLQTSGIYLQNCYKQKEQKLSSLKSVNGQQKIEEQLKIQFQQLKLENEMLRSEIRLLNYSLYEKDISLNLLQERLNLQQDQKFTLSGKNSQNIQPCCILTKAKSQSNSSLNSLSRKSISRRSSSEIGETTEKHHLNITRKKTHSILIQSETQFVINPKQQTKIVNKPIITKNVKMLHTQPLSSKKGVAKIKADQTMMEYAKSYLKIKKKDSFAYKESRQKNQNIRQMFTPEQMQNLQLISRTVGYKMRGFKCTYQQFQVEILQKYPNIIDEDEVKKILSQYPFFLENGLIQNLMNYIFQQVSCYYQSANNRLAVDIFCRKMRELIPEYQQMDEEEQSSVIQKIKKMVYVCLDSLVVECLKYQHEPGLIGESQLKLVLQRFKFTELQIDVILCQCCIISKDADNLSYEHYLSIYDFSE